MTENTLADRVGALGLDAAKWAASNEPWYEERTRRDDMAFAANAFAVAAAIRAREEA